MELGLKRMMQKYIYKERDGDIEMESERERYIDLV